MFTGPLKYSVSLHPNIGILTHYAVGTDNCLNMYIVFNKLKCIKVCFFPPFATFYIVHINFVSLSLSAHKKCFHCSTAFLWVFFLSQIYHQCSVPSTTPTCKNTSMHLVNIHLPSLNSPTADSRWKTIQFVLGHCAKTLKSNLYGQAIKQLLCQTHSSGGLFALLRG